MTFVVTLSGKNRNNGDRLWFQIFNSVFMCRGKSYR